MCLRQLVPQEFQPRRGGSQPSLPEHIDHLAIRSDNAVLASFAHPLNIGNHQVMKSRAVRQAIDHGLRQHGVGVQQDQIRHPTADARRRCPEPQLIHDACAMCGRRDDNRWQRLGESLSRNARPACTTNRYPYRTEPHGTAPLFVGAFDWFMTIVLSSSVKLALTEVAGSLCA